MLLHRSSCVDILILVLLAAYCTAKMSLDYNCFHRWKYHSSWCWHSFNATDYCDAVESCRFYGGRLTDQVSNFTQKSTSNFWVHSVTMAQLCTLTRTDVNVTKDICPLESPLGVKKLSNCSSSQQYICNAYQSSVEVGLKSGAIKDFQISSSSFYHSHMEPIGYKAQFGRLDYKYIAGTPTQGGWCSQNASGIEYYQVNLDKTAVVTGLALQGVTGRRCNFWVTLFNLSYRSNAEKWIIYRNGSVNHLFIGNKNAYQTKVIHLYRPFVAREIRINPMGLGNNCPISGDRYCLKLGIYVLHGKVFSDSMVSM